MKESKFNLNNVLKLMVEIFYNIDIICELDDNIEMFSDEKRIK